MSVFSLPTESLLTEVLSRFWHGTSTVKGALLLHHKECEIKSGDNMRTSVEDSDSHE